MTLKLNKIKWSYPTDSELLNEIQSEYDIEKLFVTETWPKEVHYRQAVTDLKMVTKAEELDPKKLKGRHLWKSYDDLVQTVKSFGGPKNPEKMLEAIEAGKPLPMPIVVKRVTGDIEVVGGNTRSGIAALADQMITALIIDEKTAKEKMADKLEKEAEEYAKEENLLEIYDSLKGYLFFDKEKPVIDGVVEYNVMLKLVRVARLRGIDVNPKEFKLEKDMVNKVEGSMDNILLNVLGMIVTGIVTERYREEKGRKEWALVSKKRGKKGKRKVLYWFGAKKPSKESVDKQEKRIQYFKRLKS